MVLVLLVAALALVITVATGGSGLLRVRIRAGRLLAAAAVIQVGTSVLLPGSAIARMSALVLTTVLVGLFLAGNLRLPGVPLAALGLLLNVVVVGANLAMPVTISAAARAGLSRADLRLDSDGLREAADSGTKLGWLGDVVPVPLPVRPQVASPGDVLVAAGIGLLLVTAGAGLSRQTETSRAERSTVLDSDSTTIGSYS